MRLHTLTPPLDGSAAITNFAQRLKFGVTAISAIAFVTFLIEPAFAQTQQMTKGRPSLNLMGEKEVDPRVEAYRKGIDQEYNSALKKIPDQKTKNSDPWASVRSGEPPKK